MNRSLRGDREWAERFVVADSRSSRVHQLDLQEDQHSNEANRHNDKHKSEYWSARDNLRQRGFRPLNELGKIATGAVD